MMVEKIKNKVELLQNGDIFGKKIVLEVTELTLQKLDAYKRIREIVILDGNILRIGKLSWDLTKKKRIYLIGAGKACNAMSKAIESILGDKLTRGISIVKILEPEDEFKRTEIFVGGHPIPNYEGYRACLEIFDLIDHSSPDDLFITVMSGGSSALMSCPVEGISLEDEMKATDLLLKSGANVLEINAVRRHISQTNGGRLAERIRKRGAEMIGFSIFDFLGEPPTKEISTPYKNFTGTPIGADNTTLKDALNVLMNYDLIDKMPQNIVKYLKSCTLEEETPKKFPDFTYFVLNTVPDSCIYAKKISEDMGLNAIILTSFLEGESKDAGTFFASIAREIQISGNPLSAPCIILSSGETSTKIHSNSDVHGHGGPSQELTASFALVAEKIPGACMLSIDSEGTDGTTNLAGAITDSKTFLKAKELGIDLHAALRNHSTYEALSSLNAGVKTGNTGTNVCDFNIMYVPRAEIDNHEGIK